MPIYRDTTTDVLTEYPESIGNHPVLGRTLELYVPDADEYEEDKVVVESPLSTQRLQRKATPKEKD